MTGQIQRSVVLLSLLLLSCSFESSIAFRTSLPANYENRRRSQRTRVKSSITSSHDYDGMYSSQQQQQQQQASDQSWYTSQNQFDQTYQRQESVSFSSNDYGIVDGGSSFGITMTSSSGSNSSTNKKGMMQKIREAFRTNREIAAFKSMDDLEKNQRTLDGGTVNRSKLTSQVLAADQQQGFDNNNYSDSYDLQYQRQLQQQNQQQQPQNNFVVEYNSDKEFLDTSSFEKLVIQAATKLGEKTGKVFGGTDPENWRD